MPIRYQAGASGLPVAPISQVAMNWAQKSVSPTRATLIYAGEPVWAGIVGRIAGDRLPGLALLGGLLIVIAVVVSELKLKRREEKPLECTADEKEAETGL